MDVSRRVAIAWTSPGPSIVSSEESGMAMKLHLRAAMIVACAVLALACNAARAQEVPLVTGEHWTKASDEQKKAYLVGIANVILIETAFHAANPPADTQTILPRMAKGLKGQTLDSVRIELDRWYAGHPDRVQRPVIETLWFELVVPGLAKPK
jgi:hypothetical protein